MNYRKIISRIILIATLCLAFQQDVSAQLIRGPELVCTNSDSVMYYLEPGSDAFNFFWTFPSDATIIGQGNDTVFVNFGVGSDSVCVLNPVDSMFRCLGVIVTSQIIINAGQDESIRTGETVQLRASGGSTYVWTPEDDLSCSDCPNPIASPRETTTYFVTATDFDSCVVGDSITVEVSLLRNLYTPNIFTPNGDGINDEWLLEGDSIQRISIQIYDRWGDRVYFSDDVTETWDGTFEGLPAPAGVYFFYIQYQIEGDLFATERTGNLTLVR